MSDEKVRDLSFIARRLLAWSVTPKHPKSPSMPIIQKSGRAKSKLSNMPAYICYCFSCLFLLQELIADELVAAVDAMSREAVGEALRLVLGNAASLATLRGAEALGPLRAMFLPLPLPAEVLMSLQPAVALSEEDQQTLSTIRLLMQLAQPAGGGGGVPRWGDLVGSTPRALQVAGELMPLVPELMPGLQVSRRTLRGWGCY